MSHSGPQTTSIRTKFIVIANQLPVKTFSDPGQADRFADEQNQKGGHFHKVVPFKECSFRARTSQDFKDLVFEHQLAMDGEKSLYCKVYPATGQVNYLVYPTQKRLEESFPEVWYNLELALSRYNEI